MTVQPGNPQQVPAAAIALPTDTAAVGELSKVIQDTVKNEEARFNNLNTRAVAVLSATALVTALAGFFAKDILGTTLTGDTRHFGLAGLSLTTIVLAVVAGIIVFGVLLPQRRFVFGNNEITDNPSALTTQAAVQAEAYREYVMVYTTLVNRNSGKANALRAAYVTFFAAVGLIALTVVGLVGMKWGG